MELLVTTRSFVEDRKLCSCSEEKKKILDLFEAELRAGK